MKKLKIAYYIIVGLFCLIAVLLIISVLPITGNFKVLTVLSGSMEPNIHTGSVVVVKPTKDYKIGDVITFGPYTKTQTPTTHRIKDIRVQDGQEVYITKGDANGSPDTREITKKDIIGKAWLSVPLFGYVVSFARKPVGFMILIIVPVLVIVIDEVKKIIREVKKKKLIKPEENSENKNS
jgi:signal peptidase